MQTATGAFEILEILGEGSFGTVCVARVNGDPLRRRVALKILKGAYASNRKILNRTRDEARLLSLISHPNIVRVEQLMDINGRPVVVMEHVQGVSLDHLLARCRNGLPASIAVEIVRQTCLALHVAYNETPSEDGRPMHVIHRDIKPSNILLSVHGEVKVVDFGIAKGQFDGREAETESVVMGSRPYMAPERLDGMSDAPAVDVYSAGMSLFELLTGRTMVLSINPVSHEQAMNRQLAYLRVPGMPEGAQEDLRDIVRRMCAYDRDHRPTALEAAQVLEQCLYAIPAEERVALEDFARTTVVPLYESRPRITPDQATLDDTSEGEFLREVAGSTGPTPRRIPRPGLSTPYAFAAVLLLLVGVLGALAADKALSTTAAEPEVAAAPASRRVDIKLWIPGDAQAQIGEQFLPTPGHVQVFPGVTLAQLYFDDGAILNCTFRATDGAAVRYVVESGRGAVSVDDGAAQPCVQVQPPDRGAVAGQP